MYYQKNRRAKCLVKLVEVFSEMNKRFEELRKRLTVAVTQLTSAEADIRQSAALYHLIEPSYNPSLDDPAGARRFNDSVSTGSRRRIQNTENAELCNIPDRQPLKKGKQTIMKAFNVEPIQQVNWFPPFTSLNICPISYAWPTIWPNPCQPPHFSGIPSGTIPFRYI